MLLQKLFGFRRLSSQLKTLDSALDTSKIVSSRRRMTAFEIHGYGDVGELQFTKTAKKPHLRSPNEVLVKVSASSVNPIDVAMIGGYGATLLNTLRCGTQDIEFPLVLGRDFTGTIVQKGLGANLKVGSKIWGVSPVHKNGCHAEYVVVDESCVSLKPENLSDVDASAVLYAGLTAWSGLYITGQLGGFMGAITSSGGGKDKKVLVLGASGGVGSMAVQMLLAEDAHVTVTCSSDAFALMQNLGVHKIIDYSSENSDTELIMESPYDIILDCAGKGPEYAATLPWTFKNYVTFNSPLLKNFDDHGLITGGLKNAKDLVSSQISALNSNGLVKWGYFVPAPNGIKYLKKLCESRKLLPIIDSTFKYKDTNEAYAKVQQGHLRGKVVIDHLS